MKKAWLKFVLFTAVMLVGVVMVLFGYVAFDRAATYQRMSEERLVLKQSFQSWSRLKEMQKKYKGEKYVSLAVPPSQPVDSDNRTEVQEDDNVHLTHFLGYEFGKVYSMHDQMLENPWFGFLTVSVDFDEPLRCLRFGKDTYESIVKDEITELVSAFENKYGMKFLTHGDTEANYRGKHTSIRIWFSPNKKDSFKGTLRMEVEDVQLAKEWLRKYEQEHKEQQKADIERM